MKMHTRFGVHPGQIAAGSKDDYSVSGYTEFSIGSSTGKRFQLDDSLISMTIQFDTVSLGSVSFQDSQFTLYSCTEDEKYSRTVQSAGEFNR